MYDPVNGKKAYVLQIYCMKPISLTYTQEIKNTMYFNM